MIQPNPTDDVVSPSTGSIIGTTKMDHRLTLIALFSRLPYNYLVGGVFAISKDHLIQVNGYSNLYWGWGAEDDDMSHRYETG